MKTAVIIPTYNEEDTIFSVVKKAKDMVDEVIVINDGSTDKTADKVKEAGGHLISHKTNQGKGASLISGINYALEQGFEIVICMDADGQHDPQEIPKFIEAYRLKKGNIIMGNRLNRCQNMPRLRYWVNRTTSFFVSFLAKQRIPDSQCGFRLFEVAILKNLTLKTKNFDTESEILIKLSRRGHKVASLPIQTIYSTETSHVHPLKDTIRFIKLIIKIYVKF